MKIYNVEVTKVSGTLNESVLPSKKLVIKRANALSEKQLMETVSEYFENKYGLVVEELNYDGFDSNSRTSSVNSDEGMFSFNRKKTNRTLGSGSLDSGDISFEEEIHRPEEIVVRMKITGKRKNRKNEYDYYLEDGEKFDVIYTADIEATDYRNGRKLHWTNVDLAFDPSSGQYNVFDLNQRPSVDWEDGKFTAGSSAIFDFLEVTLPYGKGDSCPGDVVNPFLAKLLKSALKNGGSTKLSFKNSH